MTDLLAGRVQISFAPISTTLPFIKDGKLNALAVTSAKRQPHLPDVPTLEEQGVKGIDLRLGQILTVDFALSVGGTAESVQVTAESPILDTKQSARGTSIRAEQLEAASGIVRRAGAG